MNAFHYNPDWLGDDDLIAHFVARQDEFKLLRDDLARAQRQGSVQHYLLVGLRGAGKTTLLKRLAVSIRRDTDLRDHLIALSFPEELYQVKNLADFWWAACQALVDELDRMGRADLADPLDTAIAQARGKVGDPLSNAGLQTLLATCAQLERRPVLLVDNLDMIFQRIDKSGRKLKDPHAPAYWALREALSTTTAPIVIGGSVRLSEPFTDYDKAFYDFFLPKRLGKLSLVEVMQVLERLADAQGAGEIKQRLKQRPSRIETLHELTGGNPRALNLIFELLRLGPDSRAVEDFERLMDITTPYYKARLEDLSEQAQVVMHALAVLQPGEPRFGHTAAEIGTYTSLPTNTVSTQLDILEREGVVEKSAAHGRTQYRIAEQLFRLWLQMRSTRRIRQNVIGLTEFLQAMFDQEELQAMYQDEGSGPLSRARLAFAVAGSDCDSPWQRGLEAQGADQVLQHVKAHGGKVEDHLAREDMPEYLQPLVALREILQANPGDLNKAEQTHLLGSTKLRLEQKRASVQALANPDTAEEEATRLRRLFEVECRELIRNGMRESDLPLLFKKRAQGLLPLPQLMPADAEAACAMEKNAGCREMVWRLVGAQEVVRFGSDHLAKSWLKWGRRHADTSDSTAWANVAGAMRRSQQLEPAKRAVERALELGASPRAWYEQGALLVEIDKSAAENAIRKAIELDATDPWSWNGLGNLADKLQRCDEAEAAYRKAIEIDPTYAHPWNNLGILLADKLQRYDEAEAAFRKAIEFDPTFAFPWNNLGYLLAEKMRRDEAEAAYRTAIEIDPTYAHPWNNLGVLLADKPQHYDEAEAAYRKAMELDPDIPLNGALGRLLEKQGRFDEAEIAYAEATQRQNTEYWRFRLNNLRTKRLTLAAVQTLESGQPAATRVTLEQLLKAERPLQSILISETFIEGFLAPTLTKDYAVTLLGLLRVLGFDKHARPLLLAFEAAIAQQPERLDDLEPEVRGAAKHMYQRLTAAKPE